MQNNNILAEKEYIEAAKALVNGLVDPIRTVDTEAVKDTLETICELQFVTEAGLEIYKQAIYSKLDGTVADLANVYDYSNEQFSEDLLTLIEITDKVFDSKIYKVITEKELPGEECIPYIGGRREVLLHQLR